MLFTSMISVNAQQSQSGETKDRSNNFSLGFHLNNFQNDFGYGINVTSPFFVNYFFALNLSYNMAERDGILKTDSISNWYEYSSFKIGITGVGGMVGKSIRAYGEGGLIVLFPNSKFSSHTTEIGGYGVWGFEFILNPIVSYYLEFGGIGVKAKADKMIGKPIYSNGFTTTVGLHFYL